MARGRAGRRSTSRKVTKSKPKKCEQSSKRLKKIASEVLRGKGYSKKAKSLAGSVLTQ